MALRAAVLVFCLIILPNLTFAQESEVKQVSTNEEGGGETAEGIRSTLQSYLKAFQEKDIDGVMAVFADKPYTVMMGTGPGEIWQGKANIKMAHHAFFTDFVKESSERTLVSIGANGDAAWLTGYIVVTQQHQDGPETFQINLSMVLERIDNVWYMTTIHFSNLTGPK
jgi:uncharacterized protein (TIGR02246 family)